MISESCHLANQQMFCTLVGKILTALPESHAARMKVEPLVLAADESTDFGTLLTFLGRLITTHRENELSQMP